MGTVGARPCYLRSVSRRLAPFALLALLVLASVTAFRCASPQCQINSDCPARQYCSIDNVCLQECAEDRDCEDRGVCNANGRCVAPTPDAGSDSCSRWRCFSRSWLPHPTQGANSPRTLLPRAPATFLLPTFLLPTFLLPTFLLPTFLLPTSRRRT